MAGTGDHERFVGVDRGVLDKDVWNDAPEKTGCPVCGMQAERGTIRCPRCNALLLKGCGGSCASCGAGSCEKRGDR